MRFVIVVDTREKKPYSLAQPETVRKKLVTGDYSLVGYEDVVAIERKGFSDLYNCLGARKARFKAQIKRLRGFKYKAIILDCTVFDILQGHWKSTLTGGEAYRRVLDYTYGIPTYFAGDTEGERTLLILLAHIWKEEHKVKR